MRHHGVGTVRGLEAIEVAGEKLELLAIEHDDLLLHVRPDDHRLRGFASKETVEMALEALGEKPGRGRPRKAWFFRVGPRRPSDSPTTDLVEIAKALARMHRQRATKFTGLDLQLQRGVNSMAKEITAVLGLSHDAAIRLIEDHLGRQSGNLLPS